MIMRDLRFTVRSCQNETSQPVKYHQPQFFVIQSNWAQRPRDAFTFINHTASAERWNQWSYSDRGGGPRTHSFPTCKKTAESLWYKLTSCRLAMVSITPMAQPAAATMTASCTTSPHSGMTANTSEMMSVEEKRADRDEHSLSKGTGCNTTSGCNTATTTVMQLHSKRWVAVWRTTCQTVSWNLKLTLKTECATIVNELWDDEEVKCSTCFFFVSCMIVGFAMNRNWLEVSLLSGTDKVKAISRIAAGQRLSMQQFLRQINLHHHWKSSLEWLTWRFCNCAHPPISVSGSWGTTPGLLRLLRRPRLS